MYHFLPALHVFLVISEEEHDTSGRAEAGPYPKKDSTDKK
jgi:hypothetical protein